jgi:hypothetical protein
VNLVTQHLSASNSILARFCRARVQVGDKIEYIKVLDGAQNLKNGPPPEAISRESLNV